MSPQRMLEKTTWASGSPSAAAQGAEPSQAMNRTGSFRTEKARTGALQAVGAHGVPMQGHAAPRYDGALGRVVGNTLGHTPARLGAFVRRRLWRRLERGVVALAADELETGPECRGESNKHSGLGGLWDGE